MSADTLLRQPPRNHRESETYAQGFLTHPLREKNQREIDPTDPRMSERYGLTQSLIEDPEEPVEEAEVVEEEPPRG